MLRTSSSSSSASSPSAASTLWHKRIQTATLLIPLFLFVLLLLFLVKSSPFSSSERLRGNGPPRVLVMVPGHGVFIDGKWDVAHWLRRFVPDIEEQIRVAIKEYASSEDALIVFSGGQTHQEVGRVSEAESYIDAAKAMGFKPDPKIILAEDFARDSFENVLFSLCRFRQVTGTYPEKYVVLGFGFKQERFVNEHRRAIRFPLERFEYREIPERTLETEEQVNLERKGTIPQFRADPYGCKPPLSTKKIERNPFHQVHSYESACPEMAGLFRACGSQVYKGPLPWDNN